MSYPLNTLNKERKLTIPQGALLILSLILFTNPMPGWAQVTTRQVETLNADGTKTVVTTTSGEPAVTTDTTKTIVTTTSSEPVITTVPKVVVVTNPSTMISLLESRRFELDRLIAARLVSGQLTPGQALKLRGELDDISAQLAAAKLQGLASTDPQVIALAKALDATSLEASGILSIQPLTPLTIVDSSTGVTKISVDSFGNIVSLTTTQPSIYAQTLEARREELQRLIANGEANALLTRAQANDFRAEIDRLNALEASAKLSGISYTSALPIALQYDYLGDRIISLIPGQTVHPLIVGSRFILTGNQTVILDDVMVRRADLEGRIASALALGSLSPHQAASLRAQMDEIARQEAEMRADGSLNFKESRQLYTAFDRVGSRLDGYVAHR